MHKAAARTQGTMAVLVCAIPMLSKKRFIEVEDAGIMMGMNLRHLQKFDRRLACRGLLLLYTGCISFALSSPGNLEDM